MKICQAKKLIPKEIVERYEIHFHRSGLDIHKPHFIGFGNWKNFTVENTYCVTRLGNNHAKVILWKQMTATHVTIF